MKQTLNKNNLKESEITMQDSADSFKINTVNMKKLLSFLFLGSLLIFASCEGPIGPPGEPGEDAFIGTTFEFTGNFTTSNDYALIFNFQDNGYEPYESDVVLVYILWKDDGLDYWRPLPQTVYFSSGAILQYNFDFTGDISNNRLINVALFLDGDVDLSSVSNEYTLNQTFRIVVVPSDFLSRADVDVNNLSSILNSPAIQLRTLNNIQPKIRTDLN